MKPHPPGERRPGFTFIELIATLSIIMLIAGLLIPIMGRSRESARRTHCQSNLQQLIQALHLYAADYSGRFPPNDHEWGPIAVNYTKNSAVFRCPTEPEALKRRHASGSVRALPVPGGAPRPFLFSSYAYRGGLANDDLDHLPVARDWGTWHRGGVNVGHVGGHVTWETGRQAPPLPPGPGSTPRPEPAPGPELGFDQLMGSPPRPPELGLGINGP